MNIEKILWILYNNTIENDRSSKKTNERDNKIMMQKIQKFGGAMLAPVLLFAFSGMMVGISVLCKNEMIFGSLAAQTSLWFKVWKVIEQGAWTVFNQMPLLFVVGLPIGLARKENAKCCMEALILYLTFNYFINQILAFWGPSLGVDLESVARTSGLATIAGIRTLDTSMFGAIIVSGMVVYLHNRFYETELPECLAIFKGPCFVTVIGFFVMLFLAAVFVLIWPNIQKAMYMMQGFLVSAGNFGLWLYALLLKLLLPFGLHHFVYAPIEFDNLLIDGGTVAYWAQHLGEFAQSTEPLKALFPQGGYGLKGLVKVFGTVGAALALYSTAKPQKKKVIAGLMIPATLTAVVAGITEPLEYTFLFVAPGLFVLHAVLSAFLVVVSYMAGVVGNFGGGLIEWITLNYIPLAANHWQTYLVQIIIGVVFTGIWFVTFRFVILKFNLKTPGREADEENAHLITKTEYKNSTEGSKKAKRIELAERMIEGLGGKDNIKDVTNCMTRLRVSVHDISKVKNNDWFVNAGAHGVVKAGSAIQVIIGVNVPFVKAEVQELLDQQGGSHV